MSGTPKTDKDLFEFLDGLGIDYVNHEHRPVFTVAEGQDLRDAIPAGIRRTSSSRTRRAAISCSPSRNMRRWT